MISDLIFRSQEAQIEKAKEKIKAEIDEMNVSLDQAQILNNSMERKARNFDKLVVEWKRKVDGLGMDLDVAQKECRNASSDLFKVKAAYQEIWDEKAPELFDGKNFEALSSKEVKELQSKYPVVISEAEPTDFAMR